MGGCDTWGCGLGVDQNSKLMTGLDDHGGLFQP